MKLKIIAEHTFTDGTPFYTDFQATTNPEKPFITSKMAKRLSVAYHASMMPNLAKVGIKSRQALNLPDLYKQGLDTTHQDSVYLAVNLKVLKYCTAPDKMKYIYQIDLRPLSQSLFAQDEDAMGHCCFTGDNWVDSVMCMGTFRYKGDISPNLITLLH